MLVFNKKNFCVGLTFLFSVGLVLLPFAAEAAPQFMVSWRANNYVPTWYQGKVFPTKGSPVEIIFELIDNGKIVDLQKTVVRWYINDELVKNEDNGLGIKSLQFNMPDYAGQETEVRIAIPFYPGGQLDSIVRIPVKSPEVVIDANIPDRRIGTGKNLFQAFPFFFNVASLKNLSFDWLANDKTVENVGEEPWLLRLNVDSQTPSGFGINVRAAVQNTFNQLESASRNSQLIIK